MEEILSPHFGGVIQFVREGENLVEKEMFEELKQQESKYKYTSSHILVFVR